MQLTVDENYAVFDPNDINVNKNLKPTRVAIIDGGRLEFVYVMLTQTTYVDKTRKKRDHGFMTCLIWTCMLY